MIMVSNMFWDWQKSRGELFLEEIIPFQLHWSKHMDIHVISQFWIIMVIFEA